jgi:protein-disulfide isomerase/uncharacterized membrane protein
MNVNNEQKIKNKNSPLYYIGGLLLLAAFVFTFLLAGTKLGLYKDAPGCGVGSGCDDIINGPWGSIPVLLWPVSFVGLAWFVSLFSCWVSGDGSRSRFLWVVRIGALASIGFFAVMLGIGHFCKWCAIAHVCNLLFWIIAEFEFRSLNTRGKSSKNGCPLVPFALVFVSTSALLWIVQFAVSSYQEKLDKESQTQNIENVLRGGSDMSTLKLLETKHRIGPKDAPVQVVIFTDYQCPDCKRIEGELAAIVARRDDVSVSVKHFPLCYDCNDNIGTFKLHANACWAARAAEAAEIVGGEEGWEKMHTWLFEQGGRFTDATFPTSLRSLGFDPGYFIPAMMGDETMQRVKSDSNDGFALGIYFTPMVFVNGVEYLWYYGGVDSLGALIDTVAANVVGGTNSYTGPPNAAEKLVEDWRRGRDIVTRGNDAVSWTGSGPVEFVVWGDYQAPLSGELDREVNKLLSEDNSQVTYSFRHFPVDEACNAGVSSMSTKYDGSCVLAKLVEAVDILGGNKQRWEMHDWLFAQPKPININLATLQAAALSGVDKGVLQDVIAGIEVNNRMRLDILSKNLVWRKSIPVISIDGRFLPRWRSDDVPASELFHRIVEVVGSERTNQ